MSVLEKLTSPLTMSMFATQADLYREQESQRKAAAVEIEKLDQALRDIASCRHMEGDPWPEVAKIIREATGIF